MFNLRRFAASQILEYGLLSTVFLVEGAWGSFVNLPTKGPVSQECVANDMVYAPNRSENDEKNWCEGMLASLENEDGNLDRTDRSIEEEEA